MRCVVLGALGALCFPACSSPTSPASMARGAGASPGGVSTAQSGSGVSTAQSGSGGGTAQSESSGQANATPGSGASMGASAAGSIGVGSAGNVALIGMSGSASFAGSPGSSVLSDAGGAVASGNVVGFAPSADGGLCCHVAAQDMNCYGTAYYRQTATISCDEVIALDASTDLLTWTCSYGDAGATSETSPFCASPDCRIGAECNLGIPPATSCLGTVEACP